MRPSGRQTHELRKVAFERGISKHAEGSCLVRFGDTHVLCAASLEERLPAWLKGQAVIGAGVLNATIGVQEQLTRWVAMNQDHGSGIYDGSLREQMVRVPLVPWPMVAGITL